MGTRSQHLGLTGSFSRYCCALAIHPDWVNKQHYRTQLSSVAELCPTLCDPIDSSMPGLPVLYHLLEIAQTHVHWVGDAVIPHFLSLNLWAMPCRATQDGWVMVESSDKMWSTAEGNGKPLQYSCLENAMKRMKKQKDMTLKDEIPRSVGAQYATGE